ncbi:hypothetical protein DPMN_182610 [Dreissena polymorpha]|uniref:Uncharacterized protein n=1 Tax=Dreissena polymorpha TaxID=45954 RepID=A0A9D4DEI3_DREPO|nr:hypothetical protein DPMN_182610 [Dreissena polymorpha]
MLVLFSTSSSATVCLRVSVSAERDFPAGSSTLSSSRDTPSWLLTQSLLGS